MRRTLSVSVIRLIIVLLAGLAASANAQTWQFHGFLTGRETYVNAQPSWLQGGVGRFDVGADTPDDHRLVNVDSAQLGIDWTPAGWLLLHADGIARQEQTGFHGKRLGIVQAYADVFNDHWRLRAGEFWLPTSRENTDPMWTSKYTITYSALNSWIAQEVRPIGADLQWSPGFYVSLGATAFRGNDTMGTLLAARGWTFGNYLTTYDENMPLPYPETTKPMGADLDRKNGYSERIRLSLPERAMIQFAHIDNRAPIIPDTIKGQTPWQTHFNVISADAGSTSDRRRGVGLRIDRRRIPGRQLHDGLRHRVRAGIARVRPRAPHRTCGALRHARRDAAGCRRRPREWPRVDSSVDARNQRPIPHRTRIRPRHRRPSRCLARLRSAHERIDDHS
jgi:hypothetical protein